MCIRDRAQLLDAAAGQGVADDVTGHQTICGGGHADGEGVLHAHALQQGGEGGGGAVAAGEGHGAQGQTQQGLEMCIRDSPKTFVRASMLAMALGVAPMPKPQ